MACSSNKASSSPGDTLPGVLTIVNLNSISLADWQGGWYYSEYHPWCCIGGVTAALLYLVSNVLSRQAEEL